MLTALMWIEFVSTARFLKVLPQSGWVGRVLRTGFILLLSSVPVLAQLEEPELDAPALDTARESVDSIFQPMDAPGYRPGQLAAAAAAPGFRAVGHAIGKFAFPLSNFGRFGIGLESRVADCLTGVRIPDGEYPRGMNAIFLYKGGIWIGGIVGTDTLVSTGTDMDLCDREFIPDIWPFGKPERRSTLDPYSPEYQGAVSEQDYIITYTDTISKDNSYPSYDDMERRPHRPLNVRVTQRSYVWSYDYADDLVFFTCRVENIGKKSIRDMYFGIFMDIDIRRPADRSFAGTSAGCLKERTGGRDDLTGFILSYPTPYTDSICSFMDTVRLAYTLDHDGEGSTYTSLFNLPSAVGVRFLRPPLGGEKMAYNWWIPNYNPAYDFGPQTRDHFRNMGSGVGAPRGDRNKYFVMSNGETDYDQIRTPSIRVDNPVWMPTNQDIARQYTRGADNMWVLSIGPYDVNPGEYVDIPFALVGCENIHVDVLNFFYNLNFQYLPNTYFKTLNMPDLVKNAAWAGRIYDNPGVDTDSDGFAGQFRVCVYDSALVDGRWVPTVAETTYYEGDGVPDWRAASPPPSPKVWITPVLNGVHVRFNGKEPETTRDFLSSSVDFEGYRVYLGRDERYESLVLVASYDRENYDIYRYNSRKKPKADFELIGDPVTLQELKCRFGRKSDPCNDPIFNPLRYSAADPWISPDFPTDSIFYFKMHDYNASVFGVQTPIRKRFPSELPPSLPPTPDQYTDDGYLKYYEYELDIPGLLPTLLYYVNVTAFDFGSPKAGLLPMESSRIMGVQSVYALADAEQLEAELPPVYIFPNPYRIDAGYRREGYEGLGESDLISDRVRAIHFVNLPAQCIIRIHSLDGDLVKEIHHNADPSDPKCHYDKWDLISRNTQMVVSGLYYWTVEDTQGKVQIGKLVILM